jgi:hypothetical protein
MRGLDDLVRQGKVLFVGIPYAPACWVALANTLAEFEINISLDDSLISRLRWTAIRVVSGDVRGIEALLALLSMTSLADPGGLLYYSDFVCAR